MMMIVDTSAADVKAADLASDLSKIGEELGVIIRCQREDIFNMMHRI